MAQSTISIRMDPTLKAEFDTVCRDLGMSMSTAVVMLAKKMTREKRLPFEVSADPFYSEANLQRLRAAISQMEETGGTIHDVPELSKGKEKTIDYQRDSVTMVREDSDYD